MIIRPIVMIIIFHNSTAIQSVGVLQVTSMRGDGVRTTWLSRKRLNLKNRMLRDEDT